MEKLESAQEESPPRLSRPPYDRRWWLVGMAVAVIAIIVTLVLFTPRGGGGGDMPGMEMGGSSGRSDMPAVRP